MITLTGQNSRDTPETVYRLHMKGVKAFICHCNKNMLRNCFYITKQTETKRAFNKRVHSKLILWARAIRWQHQELDESSWKCSVMHALSDNWHWQTSSSLNILRRVKKKKPTCTRKWCWCSDNGWHAALQRHKWALWRKRLLLLPAFSPHVSGFIQYLQIYILFILLTGKRISAFPKKQLVPFKKRPQSVALINSSG